MIEWVKTKHISIFFDKEPITRIRQILPSLNKFEKLAIQQYPYKNMKDLKIIVFYHLKSKKYDFTIPKGYCWNGADIPSFLWSILRINKNSPEVMIGSMLHDFTLENKKLIDYDRMLTTNIFKYCIIEAGIPIWKANIMSFVMDKFQATICSKEWK